VQAQRLNLSNRREYPMPKGIDIVVVDDDESLRELVAESAEN